MNADAPSPPDKLIPAAWYWLMRTPLTVLAIYCLVSIGLEENYPFSHYPMYSNPSAGRSYYMMADAATGNPLPIADLTGITCPKIGKIWRTKIAEIKKDKDKSEIDEKATNQAVGLSFFDQLRGYAKEKNQVLPARLQIRRVEISYSGEEVVETPEILATE
jgi:hypothetical protein